MHPPTIVVVGACVGNGCLFTENTGPITEVPRVGKNDSVLLSSLTLPHRPATAIIPKLSSSALPSPPAAHYEMTIIRRWWHRPCRCSHVQPLQSHLLCLDVLSNINLALLTVPSFLMVYVF